jgi:hypothetical protein
MNSFYHENSPEKIDAHSFPRLILYCYCLTPDLVLKVSSGIGSFQVKLLGDYSVRR